MAGFAKIVALSSVAQAVYNRWRLPYLVAGVIVMACLTIVTSIMICAALMAGFYAIFYVLIHNGWQVEDAALIIAGLVALTALLFVLITVLFIRYLKDLPHKLLSKTSKVTAQATDVIDAFLDGLMADDAR